MLDHLHQKAAQTLASVDSVILSSFGPADIQISRVPSISDDLILYVFIPRSSDHLLNLEHRQEVVVAVDEWELQGNARLLDRYEIPMVVHLSNKNSSFKRPESFWNKAWGCTVEIHPTRLTIHSLCGQGNLETIDFNPERRNK
jgi:hypothetical protein